MGQHPANWLAKLASVSFTALVCSFVIGLAVGDRIAFAVPPAPTPLAPSNGASGPVPFTISWSPVTDPSGAAIIAYNWQLSPSSTMTPVIAMDSTSLTQDVVSGLPDGAYFWRVQAVNSAGQQGAWSAAQTFNAVGAAPGTLSAPLLGPTQGYSTFHPWESITFNWGAVSGAVSYRLEVSNDPSFPLGTVTSGVQTFWFDNIRGTTTGYIHTDEGNWFARVFATDSDFAGGVRSLPSNVIQFSVFYNNPIGPAPLLISPLGNPTLTLPVNLSWAHVPNPQPSGYILEVAKDSTFSTIEWFYNQYTEPSAEMLSLTSGSKFWRVRSQQGLSSPTTNALTAWSTTGQFTISAAPATPVSIEIEGLAQPQVIYSGASILLAVQLTAGVSASGATIALTSSNPSLAPVPATIAMPGSHAWTAFQMTVGQVTVPTLVTLTAMLNGVSASGQFTVLPPTLNNDPLQANPVRGTGGTILFGYVDLEGAGVAPSGGFVVNLATNSAAAIVPATVTIPAGYVGTGFSIQTSAVAVTTPVTIFASAGSVTAQWEITLEPSSAPISFFVRPMSTTNGSQGTVLAGEGVGFDQILQVSSSNPALAAVPSVVTVFAGSGIGFFSITTAPVTAPTIVTISVSGGGVTLSHPLTLYPSLPPLAALTVNPTSVVGGIPATGTVSLASPAPAVGVAVNLGSSLPLAASVPASVIIPAGATSADFPVTTFPHDTTTAQLSATLDSVALFTTILVNPPPLGPTLTAVSLNPTSVVGGNSATGTVTLSAAAPSGGALVSLSETSSAVTMPTSVTVAAGATSANFSVTTSSVTASTSATISAVYAGVTRTAVLTVTPASGGTLSAPTLISPVADATPAQPVIFDWSDVANATSYEVQIDDSSTIAAPFVASQTVTASAATIGGLPAQRLWWRVRARDAAGVFGPFSAARRFTPQAASTTASLSSVSVSPTSVVGGNASTGTVTLTAAAPAGGAVVALASSNGAAVTIPVSVTVAAGATSANFTVTTSSVATSTAVTITASYNGVSRTAALTVNPVSANATLTVTASGRSGAQVTSSPAGINVTVGSTGAATFAVNTSITLSVVSGRDAIWSGACSSGGIKAKSCAFTITGDASVTANVR